MKGLSEDSETVPIELALSNSNFDVDRPDQAVDEALPELDNPQFKVVRLLKQGGMGLVYLARDEILRRDVAIKVLRSDLAHLPRAVADFTREAYVMSELTHPGVTPIYGMGCCRKGRPYHVMKLVDGVTFAQILGDPQRSTAERLNIFVDVCQTMAFAHSLKIIHLDLKPSNVMVGAFGEVNVMDWGLARRCIPSANEKVAFCKAEGKTRQQSVNGTPQYMSPEQARGGLLDERADVFSLGGMLCEILCGHAPYEGKSLRQLYRYAAYARTSETLNRLKNCGLDEALVRLAINCLSCDPINRPQNAIVLSRIIGAHQEATLHEVQSDMNRFFELSFDLFCIADLDGYFVRINSNFSKRLGHSHADLLSRPFLHFVHEDDRNETVEQMSVLSQGKPVVRFRNRYLAATGNYVTLEWTAKSISDERLIFAVARDVTENT
jgi:PAS domain S-box-containing protein